MSSLTAVGIFVVASVANYVFAVDSHAFNSATNGANFLVEYTFGPSGCDDGMVHSLLSFCVGKVSADQLPDWSGLPNAANERTSYFWKEQGLRGGVGPLSCATCGPSLETLCSSVAVVASPGTWTQSTCAPLSTP